MMQHVIKNIYQVTIKNPDGMGSTNCYLVKGKREYTIIDTGMYSNQAITTWEEVLNEGVKIDKIVLTHVHPDHIGMANG